MGFMNQFKTAALLALLTAFFLFIGNFFGGRTGLYVALAFSLLMNVGMYWFSHKIVLKMYRAQPMPRAQYKWLYDMVHDLAKGANLPMPSLYIVPSANPNAFATGRSPKHAVVACTTGILQLLSKDELRGVLAHELSHVKNRDMLVTTIAATLAGVISYLATMAQWAAIFGGFGGRDRDGGNMISLLLMAILAPIIAMIIQLAISRSREYLADASGAKLIKNGESLARALQKLEHGNHAHPMRGGNPATSSLFIVNPFSGRALAGMFSTHPATTERVKRLEGMKF